MFVETSAKEIINHTVQDIRTVFIKKKRKEKKVIRTASRRHV